MPRRKTPTPTTGTADTADTPTTARPDDQTGTPRGADAPASAPTTSTHGTTPPASPTAPPLALAYLLRIELLHLKPTVYRDILVAPDVTLRRLHTIIQAAMGWDNAHRYFFALPTRAGENVWRIPSIRRWEPPNDDGWGERANSDGRTRLGEVLRAPRDRLLYLYDLGDEWLHRITLRDVVRTSYPLPYLLKAQQGCPPEDCGGPPGAAYWAAAWYDPQHEDHAIAREMFGDEEPGTLHFAALQRAVARLQPRQQKPDRKH